METEIIKVDIRGEDNICKRFDQNNIVYKKELLLVGDIVYKNLCIERKQIMDFMNSVFSGRMFEQAYNMSQNYERPIIIIHGRLSECFARLPNFNVNVYYGAVASLLMKYKVEVLHCESEGEFSHMVMKLCEKTDEPLGNIIKKLKLNDADVYINMLSCVPGLGIVKARQILDKYKFKEILSLTREQLQELDGIGPKLSESIKHYLH